MTSDNPENTITIFDLNGEYIHITTKFHVYMKIYTYMNSCDPWMTSDDPKIPSKICLEMVIIPTKFQVHTKVYTNPSNDP